MDYFEKIEKITGEDLTWNIPERKQGTVNVIGGNSGNFKAEVKNAEFLSEKYPIENVNAVLPDVLEKKLPNLPNLKFLPSTESGSFGDLEELSRTVNSADFNLLLGDLSKNQVTGRIVVGACENSEKPLLITRDTVDLIAENSPEKLLMNENLIFLASIPQLRKLLQAVYYPKMLLMSQSLIQVVEVLHKFTLSYPVKIVTLHLEQILVAENGMVKAIPLANSGYVPFTFWNGEIAGKIVVLNLYNPNNFIPATITAILD